MREMSAKDKQIRIINKELGALGNLIGMSGYRQDEDDLFEAIVEQSKAVIGEIGVYNEICEVE